MTARSNLKATVIGIAAVLVLAPAVLADTCCAHIPIGLDPPSAKQGDAVRLIGLQCLNADGSGPLPLSLGAFWLATGKRPAAGNDVPGPGLPKNLPPIEEWLPFDSVLDEGAGSWDATITVPALPDGRYQLWWWCDGTGPGGGIHYSTGPRLAVGASPETATEAVGPPGPSGSPDWRVGLLVALGAAVFLGTVRAPRAYHGRERRDGAGRTRGGCS